MHPLPVSIGLSINDKKCYYLSWIPSESGPLIINYGNINNQNDKMPFNYLFEQIKQYDANPRFTISLSNDYVKYDFLKSYKNSSIDNWNANNFYNNEFLQIELNHLLLLNQFQSIP